MATDQPSCTGPEVPVHPPDLLDRGLASGEDLPHVTTLRWLVFILAVAGVLRSVGLTYQLPIPDGPDHLGLIGVALRMGTGDLNPHMFTWPAAPFYLLAVCFGVMFAACRTFRIVACAADFQQWFFDDPSAFYLFVRLIMVAVGLLNVVMIYRIGCLLGSRRRGLWAAALLAVTPVDVIMCHYQKAEPLLVLSVLVALAALIRWWQRDSTGRAAAAGAAIGLACAVKYNAAMLIAPAAVTWVHHACAAGRPEWGRLAIRRQLPGCLCLAGVFFLLNPYLLLDAREAMHQLAGQTQVLQAGDSPIHQTPVRSYLTVLFPVAFGPVLYAIYVAGFGWLVFRSLRRRTVEIALLVFVLAYSAGMMTQKLVTPYYPLPMVPALALGAAGAFAELTRRIRPVRWIGVAILSAPVVKSVGMAYQMALPGPTFLAEYWIHDCVPHGDRLAGRHWLPPHLPAHRLDLGCYPWPQESRIRRDQIEAFIQRGARWFVLQGRDVAGREEELFGSPQGPTAVVARRFLGPHAYLPMMAPEVDIWKVSRPADVPPLSCVLRDPHGARPGQRLDVTYEGGTRLLGFDPPDARPVVPGDTVEVPTYWLVPAGTTARLLITGGLSGSGGYLGDLTHEMAYGIDDFIKRPTDRPCGVVHRVLIRPGYRAKPGDYVVRVGVRDADRRADLTIVNGPAEGNRYCELTRIVVQRPARAHSGVGG